MPRLLPEVKAVPLQGGLKAQQELPEAGREEQAFRIPPQLFCPAAVVGEVDQTQVEQGAQGVRVVMAAAAAAAARVPQQAVRAGQAVLD